MRRIQIALTAGALLVSAVVAVAGAPQTPPSEKQKPDPPPRANRVDGPPQPVAREPAEEFAHETLIILPPLTNNEIAGLPKGIQPEVLTWDRIYALALVRSRASRGAFSPTLDAAALVNEAARLGVADFARFRADFHDSGRFHDPGPAALELQAKLHAVENARRSALFHESLQKLLVARFEGNSSGLNRLDVDMALAASVRASQKVCDEITHFRDGLDELKFLLGLSPRAPVVLDRQNLKAFSGVFDAVDGWQRSVNRRTQELSQIIARLPVAGEVVLNGEPILEKLEKNHDQWETILTSAGQVALKSRSERDEIRVQPNSGARLELRVRHQIRGLYDKRLSYQAEKRRCELAVRLKDQAFERLTAPLSASASSRSSLLKGVIEHQAEIVAAQDRLISLWASFRAERLALYHDLGVLPYTDWKSFTADLSASSAR